MDLTGFELVFEFDEDFTIFIAGFANVFQVETGSSSFSLELHIDEFYF